MATSLEKLKQKIAVEKKSFNDWSNIWTFFHHSFSIGAAVLGAAAVLVLQKDFNILNIDTKSIASLFAASGALMTTIAGIVNFQKKWLSCRKSRLELDILENETNDENVDYENTKKTYEEILRGHATNY